MEVVVTAVVVLAVQVVVQVVRARYTQTVGINGPRSGSRPRDSVMCHVLVSSFMGNGSSSGGRETDDRSATTGPETAEAAMDELARDVERLKAAMDEKDREIERLGRTVDDIRVSLTTESILSYRRRFVPRWLPSPIFGIVCFYFFRVSHEIETVGTPTLQTARCSSTTVFDRLGPSFLKYPREPRHTRTVPKPILDDILLRGPLTVDINLKASKITVEKNINMY